MGRFYSLSFVFSACFVVLTSTACISETRDFVTPPEFASAPASCCTTRETNGDAGLLFFDVDESGDLTSLLPLSEVNGLSVDGYVASDDLVLPNLIRVEGDLLICHNDGLLNVQFPMLTEVGGDLVLCDNDALLEAAFPALRVVEGSLNILANAELIEVDFSALSSAGDVQINSDGLLDLELNALTQVQGTLRVGQENFAANADLISFAAPNLVSIDNDFFVQRNSSLVSLDLQALLSVGGALTISDNDALTDLRLDALLSVQDAACVCANASLAACDAQAVDDALFTTNVDVTGNSGQCP